MIGLLENIPTIPSKKRRERSNHNFLIAIFWVPLSSYILRHSVADLIKPVFVYLGYVRKRKIEHP